MAPLHRAAGCVTLVAYQSCASCRRLFNIFGLSANLRCRSETCYTRLAENTGRKKGAKKSPSGHHRTTLSGYIFGTEAHIDIGKNLLSSNMSSTCHHNMVNFGSLAVEIDPVVWAPLQITTGFASWQRYCTASSNGRQPDFAALNRGRHLCSAGRPSGWALAHILVYSLLMTLSELSSYPPVNIRFIHNFSKILNTV